MILRLIATVHEGIFRRHSHDFADLSGFHSVFGLSAQIRFSPISIQLKTALRSDFVYYKRRVSRTELKQQRSSRNKVSSSLISVFFSFLTALSARLHFHVRISLELYDGHGRVFRFHFESGEGLGARA